MRGENKARWDQTYFLAVQEDVIARADFGVDAVLAVNGARDQIQIVLAVVAFTWGEECAVEIVAVVVDGAAAAVSSCEADAGGFELTNVRLREGILMSSDNNARVIQPQHENVMVAEVVVLIDPVFEREVGEDIVGLRNENGLSDRLIFLWSRSLRGIGIG